MGGGIAKLWAPTSGHRPLHRFFAPAKLQILSERYPRKMRTSGRVGKVSNGAAYSQITFRWTLNLAPKAAFSVPWNGHLSLKNRAQNEAPPRLLASRGALHVVLGGASISRPAVIPRQAVSGHLAGSSPATVRDSWNGGQSASYPIDKQIRQVARSTDRGRR